MEALLPLLLLRGLDLLEAQGRVHEDCHHSTYRRRHSSFDRAHPRIFTDDREPYGEEVEAALPGVGQLDGGVVEVGVDHAGQDRDEGLHARHHREHLGHGMDRSPLL